MQSKEWHEEIIANIGRAMEKARDGKSDRWIADRTEKLGNPLSRTAVSEYRRGVRKTISVADWLTLSAALGVPPVSLLLPELPDGSIPLLPALGAVNQFDALLWIIGERQTLPEGFDLLVSMDNMEPMGEVSGRREYRSSINIAGGPFDIWDEYEPSREKDLINAVHQLRAVLDEIRYIRSPFEVFEQLGDDESAKLQAVDMYLKKLQEKQKEVEKIEARILKLGGVIREEQVLEYDQNGEH
ncbi:hypothetical protein V5S92_10085 [Corynebacterium accolens]